LRRGPVLLAVTLNDLRYSFFAILKTVVFVLLCLNGLPLAPHKGVALFLDSSFKHCHLPLPIGRKFTGVGLWEGWRELKRCLLCLRKQLFLLFKENSIHVTDSNSKVLYYARRTLLEKDNCLHGSTFNHLFATAMKATLR
jgi:hypothetical protein